MKKNKLIMVLFDGIKNSVFQSQVLALIQKKLSDNIDLQAHIISFETKSISKAELSNYIPKHPRLHITIKKRLPILSELSLLFPMLKLTVLLKKYKNDALEIIARGPISGQAMRKALFLLSFLRLQNNNWSLTIQARGLAAEEHRFAAQHQNVSIIKYLYNCYKYYVLKKIEHKAYAPSKKITITFEAVSNALKEYLYDTFDTPLANITIAHKDLPTLLSKSKYENYRSSIRKKYNFKQNQTVYCYSGSAKPWQCPKETIKHFENIYEKNNKTRLLILTTDQEIFKKILSKSLLPKDYYRIECVPSDKLIAYLCAADYGYLLRNHDIINWVSRPTKLLEYQAAHLQIIHNNTIELLHALVS